MDDARTGSDGVGNLLATQPVKRDYDCVAGAAVRLPPRQIKTGLASNRYKPAPVSDALGRAFLFMLESTGPRMCSAAKRCAILAQLRSAAESWVSASTKTQRPRSRLYF